MDDFSILGIAETVDPRIVKEAFRSRAKELHPDHVRASQGEDPLANHYLFIALTRAYRRVLARIEIGSRIEGAASSIARATPKAERKAPFASHPEEPPAPFGTSPRPGLSIVPHKDPAYVLYRTGMRYYMAIHPDAAASGEMDDDEAREKVRELVRLFPRAYYYFALVANEHPISPWAADAREKMASIERGTLRYKKIIESFGAWRRAGRERGREVARIVERTKMIIDEEGGEFRWPREKDTEDERRTGRSHGQ